jgi:hypothetical protein
MSQRSVTIAIPTRNRSALLARAVASALAQDYPELEVLVSDNASEDDTPHQLDRLRHPKLRILRQPRLLPMMEHWDLCLREASGELFMLLSDDDFLQPRAVQRLSAALTDEVGMAYCAAAVVDPDGQMIGEGRPAPAREAPRDTILEFFSVRRTPFPCSVLMRTADVRRAGGYTGAPLALIADARVWMAVSLQYPAVAYLDERLSSYCVHPGSATTGAGVQPWLDDNKRLARWCADALQAKGDAAGRDEVMRRLAHLDLGTAVTAILSRGSGLRGRAAALRKLLALASPRVGSDGAVMLAGAAAHLLLPTGIASALRRVRQALAGPRADRNPAAPDAHA